MTVPCMGPAPILPLKTSEIDKLPTKELNDRLLASFLILTNYITTQYAKCGKQEL